MTDERTSNWFAAAVLILIVALLGVGVWGLLERSTGDVSDDSLVGQLERYTACLSDNGANLPVVEGQGDGGFAVVVPGALLDGDIGDLRGAWEACRDAEPAFFELLFSGGGLDQLADLGELCHALPDGFVPEDMQRQLAELCEELGG